MSLVVILVDYGLALERSYSAEVEDCFDSLNFVAAEDSGKTVWMQLRNNCGHLCVYSLNLPATSLSIDIQNDFY